MSFIITETEIGGAFIREFEDHNYSGRRVVIQCGNILYEYWSFHYSEDALARYPHPESHSNWRIEFYEFGPDGTFLGQRSFAGKQFKKFLTSKKVGEVYGKYERAAYVTTELAKRLYKEVAFCREKLDPLQAEYDSIVREIRAVDEKVPEEIAARIKDSLEAIPGVQAYDVSDERRHLLMTPGGFLSGVASGSAEFTVAFSIRRNGTAKPTAEKLVRDDLIQRRKEI